MTSTAATAPASPCREWQGKKHRGGYGVKYIGNGKEKLVHRWVIEMHDGPIPEGMHVMHLCDNPACFRYDHLRVGTNAENQQDKIDKDRHAKGMAFPQSKLTDDQVREIYASTDAGVELASKYGVSRSTISGIKTGAYWSHITNPRSK